VSDAVVRIGGRPLAADAPTYVIAEIGVNHDGQVDRALELVEAAADAGADAVKFQWFEAELLVGDPEVVADYQRRGTIANQHELLRGLELDREAMARLVDASHRRGLHAVITVFNETLVPVAAELPWDAWKTASPDLVHRPLLDRLAADGRPMLVSTGAAELAEVTRTNDWLGSAAVVFLHCVSAYPTPESSAGLGAIASIASATGRPTGYSDHTGEVTTGGLAVAAGAVVLEKHLTWNRDAEGPDHAASLDPAGFADYVAFVRRARAAIGDRIKRSNPIEADVRRVARQSLRAARSLPSGIRLAATDIAVKRPGDGIEPWRMEEIVGRELRVSLEPDAPIRDGDLE